MEQLKKSRKLGDHPDILVAENASATMLWIGTALLVIYDFGCRIVAKMINWRNKNGA